MAKKRDIFSHAQYLPFVEKYSRDLPAFIHEVCGSSLSPDQLDVCHAIQPPTSRTTIASGTGTGKTHLFGGICLWHLLCFPVAEYEGKREIGSNTYIGAPVVRQVIEGTWKEMSDILLYIRSFPHLDWVTENIVAYKESVVIKNYESQWYIKPVSLGDSDSISIAGKHRFWQLIIVDEGAGVKTDHYDVITGTQTQAGNRIAIASQPATNVGYYFETHHRLSVANGGVWANLNLSSENSPFVDESWLIQKLIESGGEDSPEYKIRVKGEFCDNLEGNLISRSMIDKAFNLDRAVEQGLSWGWLLIVDVGGGEERDESVCIKARTYGYGDLPVSYNPQSRRIDFVDIPIISSSLDSDQLVERIIEEYNQLSNARVVVDRGGIGLDVVKKLTKKGVNCVGINWGIPCNKKEYKERYANRRACGFVRLRDAMKQGRVSFPKNLDNKTRDKLIHQGINLPYHINESSKYQMMSKDDMRKKGIKSPDIFDCFAFGFVEGAIYNVSDASGDECREMTEKEIEDAQEGIFEEIEDNLDWGDE